MDEQTLRFIAQQLRKPEGDAGIETAERMNVNNKAMNLNTIEALQPADGDRILEIGMGNGFFVKDVITNKDVRYTGFDYSALMVKEAEANNKDLIDKDAAAFVHGAIQQMPFADNSFNKIFTVNNVYFWDDPVEELKQIHRVLQPGGLFINTIRPDWCMRELPFCEYGFTLYSKERLSELLQQNGFTVTEIKEIDEPDMNIGEKSIRMQHVIVTSTRQ